jgi:phosphatidate cytidylyltransferase
MAVSIVLGLVGGDALLARDVPWGSALLARGSFIPLSLAFLCMLAALELDAMCRRVGMRPYREWAAMCCGLLVIAPWLSSAGIFGRDPLALEGVHFQVTLTAFAFVGTGFIAVLRRDAFDGLVNIAATWLLIGYAGLLPSFLTLLRCDVSVIGEFGAWIVLTVLLVCKVSDIGAYFAGSFFGKHKLIPAVSPGKSVEGLIGGVLASAALSLLFLFAHQATLPANDPFIETDLSGRYGPLIHGMTIMYVHMTVTQAIVFGVVMSMVGQAGDLVESVFKRSADTKDSARILPGFGGIMDMIDSPIAIAPVAWFMLTRLWCVV